MCKWRGIIWYIIHANRMLLKIWPHLTFGWPFVNISRTIHPTHSKLYIFAILMTSRVLWYTWKVIWSILKFWPLLDLCVTPNGKGPNRPQFCQNIFWHITTSKLSITHFRQNGTWLEYFFYYSLLVTKTKCITMGQCLTSFAFASLGVSSFASSAIMVNPDFHFFEKIFYTTQKYSPLCINLYRYGSRAYALDIIYIMIMMMIISSRALNNYISRHKSNIELLKSLLCWLRRPSYMHVA